VAAVRERSAQRRNEKNQHRFRPEQAQVNVGDLVLVYNTVRNIDLSSVRKLEYRWEGPFRVRKIKQRGTYFLKTLDGETILTPYPAVRIKKFFKEEGVWMEADGVRITPEIPFDVDPEDWPEEESEVDEEEREESVGSRQVPQSEQKEIGRVFTRSQAGGLVEKEVGQEVPGRAEGRDAEKVHTKGKWERNFVIEPPRGKPKRVVGKAGGRS
jgi:hypothetical protein